MQRIAALLLLADGRLPSGGYAHSGGLEPSVHDGEVRDAASLERFLAGRAATTGFTAAAFAAAACAACLAGDVARLARLDPELDARMPSPATRAVSRALGRQLLRALQVVRPHPRLGAADARPHQAIALGLAAAAFELEPRAAAQIALQESVAGPAAAAVKLLPLDPFAVHAVLARLTDALDELAGAAADAAEARPSALPAAGAPLLDLAAERHQARDVRLFAS